MRPSKRVIHPKTRLWLIEHKLVTDKGGSSTGIMSGKITMVPRYYTDN